MSFGTFLRTLPPARLTVVACAGIAAVSLIWQIPHAVQVLDQRIAHNAALNYDDRELAVGNSIFPNTALIREARAWIPRDESFRVVLGSHPVENATALTQYVATFATYYLLPRRPSPDAHWIICVGCDRNSFSRPTTVWDDGNGSSLLRLGL